MRMALLGASGCGKSVTLKCIAGIMTPDRGHIILDGETLFDSEKHINLPPQKRRVGYLFQQYALFPNMTVLQNICFPLEIKKVPKSAAARRRSCAVSDWKDWRKNTPPSSPAGSSVRPPARERPQRSTSSRTNACATSESKIARGTASFPAVPLVPMGTVFVDTFSD